MQHTEQRERGVGEAPRNALYSLVCAPLLCSIVFWYSCFFLGRMLFATWPLVMHCSPFRCILFGSSVLSLFFFSSSLCCLQLDHYICVCNFSAYFDTNVCVDCWYWLSFLNEQAQFSKRLTFKNEKKVNGVMEHVILSLKHSQRPFMLSFNIATTFCHYRLFPAYVLSFGSNTFCHEKN